MAPTTVTFIIRHKHKYVTKKFPAFKNICITCDDYKSKGFCAASAKRKQQEGTKATAAVEDDDASELVGVWHAPSSLLVEPK